MIAPFRCRARRTLACPRFHRVVHVRSPVPDQREDRGPTESDQFVGVVLLLPNRNGPPSIHVHGLSGGRSDSWIIEPGPAGRYDAEGHTGPEPAFSSLVRLPPEALGRWPLEPRLRVRGSRRDRAARPRRDRLRVQARAGGPGIDRQGWEQWRDCAHRVRWRRHQRRGRSGVVSCDAAGGRTPPARSSRHDSQHRTNARTR